jgi:hypothetical protein
MSGSLEGVSNGACVQKSGVNKPDSLDLDGNAVFPYPERAVVGRRHEAAVFVDELDGVDGAQVVVVLLDCLVTRAAIVLQDPVVRQTRQEFVPIFCRGVELDDMWCLAAVEAVDALPCLGIP